MPFLLVCQKFQSLGLFPVFLCLFHPWGGHIVGLIAHLLVGYCPKLWFSLLVRTVRFSFSFLMIFQRFEFTPLLYMTYSMALIHALSQALVTSRKVALTGVFCVLAALTASLKARRWSTVARPFLPPACASVIWTFVVALLLTIRRNSFPTLLASVIPLSFEHFPRFPGLYRGWLCFHSVIVLGCFPFLGCGRAFSDTLYGCFGWLLWRFC